MSAKGIIQYKHRDLEMDFICDCGEKQYIEGYFPQYIKCPSCNSWYEVPHFYIPPNVYVEEMEKIKEDSGRMKRIQSEYKEITK